MRSLSLWQCPVLSLFFCLNLFSLYSIPKIHYTGTALVGRGVFSNGCAYYDNMGNGSLSDHAPALYGEALTWNMAFQMSDTVIFNQEGRELFYAHKFRMPMSETTEEVINYWMKNPFFHATTLFPSIQKEDKKRYRQRIESVLQKIDEFFNQNPDLQIVALQETPRFSDSRKIFRDHIKKANHFYYSSSNMETTFILRNRDEKTQKGEMITDRIGEKERNPKNKNKFTQEFFPFVCIERSNICYVNIHHRYGDRQGIEIPNFCKNLKDAVGIIKQEHPQAKQIKFLGDFNLGAKEISSFQLKLPFDNPCADLEINTVDLNAVFDPLTKEFIGGTSCHDNKGTYNPEHIDLMVTF